MSDMVPREDLERASRLVNWMAGYIGKMAPGYYGDCFTDLNDHFISMGRLSIPMHDPSKVKEDENDR